MRLRHGLSDDLISGKAMFSETVASLQCSFSPPELVIDMRKKTVCCGGISIRLQPQLLAWYAWHAKRRLEMPGEDNFIHWRDMDPRDFLLIYRQVTGEMSSTFEETEKQLTGAHKFDEVMRISQEKNAKINRLLKEKLGNSAKSYLISSIGNKPYTRHGLLLEQSCISIRS